MTIQDQFQIVFGTELDYWGNCRRLGRICRHGPRCRPTVAVVKQGPRGQRIAADHDHRANPDRARTASSSPKSLFFFCEFQFFSCHWL